MQLLINCEYFFDVSELLEMTTWSLTYAMASIWTFFSISILLVYIYLHHNFDSSSFLSPSVCQSVEPEAYEMYKVIEYLFLWFLSSI